jgi:hypothetical protein
MLKNSLLVVCVLVFTAFAMPAAAQRKIVSGSEVTGTFKTRPEGTYQNELRILALGAGKIRFGIQAYYPYKVGREWSAHSGDLIDVASIAGDTAIYKNDDGCKFTFKFTSPGVVKVKQDGTDGNCGFGVNVYADGTYKKVSSKKPRFEEQ